MEENPFKNLDQSPLEKPDWGYDPATARASVLLPDYRQIQLTHVVVDDGEHFSTLTGISEDEEVVVLEIVDDKKVYPEVTKVIVADTIVYQVTKH